MMTNENLLMRLQKIKALIDHEGTTESERKHVQKQLDRIMQTYNVSEKDLLAEVIKEYAFKYKTKRERQLCTQVMACVIDHDFKGSWSYKHKKNTIFTKCTKAQETEINFLFDFYKKLYAEEEDILFSAFYHKHGLYKSKTTENNKKPDRDTRNRVKDMMDALQDKTPVKQIGKR